MDASKVDMYLMANSKYFEGSEISRIRTRLLQMDENEWSRIMFLQFQDPTMMLLVSIFGGNLGIDRFMIGDTGMGIGKLLTCGGLGVWYVVDLFMIMGATREKNMQKLANALQ